MDLAETIDIIEFQKMGQKSVKEVPRTQEMNLK